ncbi:hypothetical protein [Halobacillus kuroshimensis]|uniref:hypothetical protein n=1 Tax=Halobacillus kuroshimensis TaxID=302481 RepID=UPI0012EBBF32|nr:hypothetical protein [Halobacillus kuroshimensis]
MRKILIVFISLTGIYTFLHILLGFHIEKSLILFSINTHISVGLLTRLIQALFILSLLIYVKKYVNIRKETS